jgi:NitT/TauT family transport system substrate-binding protein
MLRQHGLLVRGLECIVASLLLWLAACASPGEPAAPKAAAPAPAEASAAPSPAAALIKARSAFTSFSASAAPWWMAQEAGYFREQGLDVDLRQVAAGTTLLAAMHAGELDVVFSGGPSLLLGYLQGLETMIIGSTSNSLDLSVFVRPDIQTLDEVRGKTIGAGRPKSITDIAVRLGFRRVGLEPDVDFFVGVTGGLPESLAALEAGTIDGATLNVPMVFDARKRGYRELLSIADLGIAFMNSAVGATRKVLTERPELGERYLRALAQASSRLKTDRETAIQVIGQYSTSDDRETLAATVDHYRRFWEVDPYPHAAAVQAMIDVEEHPAARTIRPEDVTDYRFADALHRSGFLDTLAK